MGIATNKIAAELIDLNAFNSIISDLNQLHDKLSQVIEITALNSDSRNFLERKVLDKLQMSEVALLQGKKALEPHLK